MLKVGQTAIGQTGNAALGRWKKMSSAFGGIFVATIVELMVRKR